MAVVQSAGALEQVGSGWPGWGRGAPRGSISLYTGQAAEDYAALYSRQPAVRMVVDFLARNVADLGLKVYRRVSATEREELSDHPLAGVLREPNPWMTRYWFLHALVSDLAIYDESYTFKVRGRDGRILLVRIPPYMVEPAAGSWLRPGRFRVTGGKDTLEVPAEAVWYVHGYNPDNPARGLSPLETLRRVLAEEVAAGEYREHYWRNAARIEGVIERPLEAPDWSDDARTRFRAEFQARYAGPEGSGLTPILEEGMSFKPLSFSARDSQWLEARKLSREEVAAAYHIPPPMVGILDNATFSNIQEQHRMLYQDTLGPWLTMIQEEIRLSLLPEFGDVDRVYAEFNLADKLRGSFEERARAIQAAVGAPHLTRNEARAMDNRPPVEGGDELVVPLNVLVGGQASPTDTVPPERELSAAARARALKASPAQVRRHLDAHRTQLERFFARQAEVLRTALGAKGRKASWEDLWDGRRWDTELGRDLLLLAMAAATDFGGQVAELYGVEWTGDLMVPYLTESSRVAAENINRTTREALEASPLDRAGALAAVLGADAIRPRIDQAAQSRVTMASNFGQTEAATAAGVPYKRWVVTSPNPRPSHAALAGQTVPLKENFSNGARWPGDPTLPVSETAGCTCLVEFANQDR